MTLLARIGATDVIHPELEGGLEIVRSTLLRLGYPSSQASQFADVVRSEHYDLAISSPDEHRVLEQLVAAADGIELTWMRLDEGSPLVGQTLAGADLRAKTGASVIALSREGKLSANPKSQTVFEAGDRVGLIGTPEQMEAALSLSAGAAGQVDAAA